MEEIGKEISLICASEGIVLWGAAENRLRYIHEEIMPAASKMGTILVFAVRVSPAVLDTLDNAPNRIYFHHYKQLNYLLDRTALKVANFLQSLGYRALPVAASQTMDTTHQRGHLSHKEAAEAAGLGWIGRNNLLVTRKYGSQVRLVTLLTDAPIAADFGSHHKDSGAGDGCGSCRTCLNACPAGAIKEKRVDFEHIACYEQIKRFSRLTGISQYICGLCVKACAGF